jgi:hypothetical protein
VVITWSFCSDVPSTYIGVGVAITWSFCSDIQSTSAGVAVFITRSFCSDIPSTYNVRFGHHVVVLEMTLHPPM